LGWSEIGWGTAAGFFTAFATLAGALPVLLSRRPTPAQQSIMLGFAAGVMLSAAYLSLIVPAAAVARQTGHGRFESAGLVAIGVLAGAASLHLIRRWQPFERALQGTNAATSDASRRAWLLMIAMTSHNLPEGAAVGVSFGAGDPSIAISTTIGIAVQNLPEGLAVAVAMLSIGRSRSNAVLIGGLSGLVEPVGAFLGVSLVWLVRGLLPPGMAWAAGAMIYICAAELIPAVHENGPSSKALGAFLIGIVSMLFLDIALS
jgi:ZIP family zinc transporter